MKPFSTAARLLLLFCLLRAGVLHAQIDSILALPGKDRQVKAFIDWNDYYSLSKDSAWVNRLLEEAEKKIKKAGPEKLLREIWFYRQVWKARSTKEERWWEPMIASLLRSADDAGRKGWKYTEAECRMYAGKLGFDHAGKYPQAFEQLLKAYDLIMEAGLSQYPEAIRFVDAIATRYYQFGDYTTAIRYFKESMNAPEPWASTSYLHETQNTIALCYQSLKQYDSALYYYRLSHERAKVLKNEFWATLTNGNIGYVYFLQGDDAKAQPLMEADYQASIKAGETASAMNAALALATLLLRRGNTTDADTYLGFARKHLNRSFISQNVNFYRNLYEISKLKGDYRSAAIYIDSFIFYRDSQSRITDTKIINQAKLKVEVEQHAHEVKLLEATRSRQVLLRNGLLALLVLLAVIAGLLVNRHLIKRRKELELAALEKKLALEELQRAKQELFAFTNTLREKNELIESFRTEIEHLQHTDASSERVENLNRLLNTSILTEDDWKQFRLLFDKVYPGFLIRLREKMPDLSPADTRLMALTKLQLSQKEMAAMLGVGYDAIRKARQRLRQKINLPEEGSLDEVAEMI